MTRPHKPDLQSPEPDPLFDHMTDAERRSYQEDVHTGIFNRMEAYRWLRGILCSLAATAILGGAVLATIHLAGYERAASEAGDICTPGIDEQSAQSFALPPDLPHMPKAQTPPAASEPPVPPVHPAGLPRGWHFELIEL